MHDAANAPAMLRGLMGSILRERPPARAIARRRHYPWIVVGTVCIGAFMGQVDASIAQLVLPVLERYFDRPLGAISWVAIGYTMSLALFLPVFGRLADLFGRKMLYTGGFLLFILGSALCGFAGSLNVLIGFRVLQAIGAALLQANSIAIVVTAAGERHRGRAIGLQAASQAVGLSAGPAIGGILIHALSWRWVFWINVPVGLLGAVLGWLVLPQTASIDPEQRFDWWGVLLLTPALAGVVLMISEGQDWGAASPYFLTCAVAVLVFLPLFVWWERRQPDPLLDLDLFRRRAFWAGNLSGLLSYAMLFGMFFLMPFVFERAYGLGPLTAGLILVAIPAMLGLLSPLSGALYDRIGARPLATGGMALSLAAFLLLAFDLSGPAPSMLWIAAILALFGVGQGLFTSPNNSSVMAAAPRGRVGQAGGILNVTRSFGTSVGVAAAAAVLAWQLRSATGGDATFHASPQVFLAAARYVLAMFALFAFVGAGLAWLRPQFGKSRPG